MMVMMSDKKGRKRMEDKMELMTECVPKRGKCQRGENERGDADGRCQTEHVPACFTTHSFTFWVLSIVCASKHCKVSIQLGAARVISHAVSQLKIVVGKKESPGHKKGEISRQYNFCLFVCV